MLLASIERRNCRLHGFWLMKACVSGRRRNWEVDGWMKEVIRGHDPDHVRGIDTVRPW